jgi:hypothetical protein
VGRDDPPLTVACPHCGSADTETVGAWGGQLITSQARCRRCNTYFEAVRDAFDPAGDGIVSPADD